MSTCTWHKRQPWVLTNAADLEHWYFSKWIHESGLTFPLLCNYKQQLTAIQYVEARKQLCDPAILTIIVSKSKHWNWIDTRHECYSATSAEDRGPDP